MVSIKSKNIAELIGFIAVIASLIFVGLQLRQDQQATNLDRITAVQTNEFEISRLIAENSDIWVRGLNNEELTQAEDATFEAVANAMFRLNAKDYGVLRARGLEMDDWANVHNYAFFVYQYPGLRRKFYERVKAVQLRDRAAGRSVELRFYPKLVDERLKELDAMSPETPTGNFVPL